MKTFINSFAFFSLHNEITSERCLPMTIRTYKHVSVVMGAIITVMVLLVVLSSNSQPIVLRIHGFSSEPSIIKETTIEKPLSTGGHSNLPAVRERVLYRVCGYYDGEILTLVGLEKKWWGWKYDTHYSTTDSYALLMQQSLMGLYSVSDYNGVMPAVELGAQVFLLCPASSVPAEAFAELPEGVAVSGLTNFSSMTYEKNCVLIEATSFGTIDTYTNILQLEEYLTQELGLEYVDVCRKLQ